MGIKMVFPSFLFALSILKVTISMDFEVVPTRKNDIDSVWHKHGTDKK